MVKGIEIFFVFLQNKMMETAWKANRLSAHGIALGIKTNITYNAGEPVNYENAIGWFLIVVVDTKYQNEKEENFSGISETWFQFFADFRVIFPV